MSYPVNQRKFNTSCQILDEFDVEAIVASANNM